MSGSKKKPILIIVLVGLLTLSFLSGFVSRDQKFFPYNALMEVKAFLQMMVVEETESSKTIQRISTVFLPLTLHEIQIPVGRPGSGGGLTSIGNELVVLTHEGKLFRIGKDDQAFPLKIDTPANGFAAYKTAAEREFSNLNHNFERFRYNDILYFDSGTESGLAVSYTEWLDEHKCYGTAIATLDLPDDDLDLGSFEASAADWQVIFRTSPCLKLKKKYQALEGHMAGGRLAFKAPATLLLGSGDYHWDGMYAPIAHAQNSDVDYGKIIQIDLLSGEYSHVSKGHRNVQGIIVDHLQRIWTVEHGPRGGDELNLIVNGANYGWPLAIYGTRYNKMSIVSNQEYGRHDGFQKPVYAWLPSVGISNLTQIRNFDPSWNDDLFVASLLAQRLYRIRLSGDRVVFVETIRVNRRTRYVHQHNDGRIALWTDDNKVVFITKSEGSLANVALDEIIDQMMITDGSKTSLRANMQACMQCHALDVDDNTTAPNLGNVHGRRIAATDYEEYSTALQSKDGNWDSSTLRNYLESPSSFAPGTTMPSMNLSREEVEDIVSLLDLLNDAE